MTSSREIKVADNVLLKIDFFKYAVLTVSLPAVSLLWCFLTGIIFQFEEVNETVCKAQNVVPSISAVTGVTPGAYIWRICIALHSTPRFAVGILHYNYYKNRAQFISDKCRSLYMVLIRVNYLIYTIENSCLVAVAFISNKENYPIHEKIFVVFMISCCVYMLLNTLIYKWSRSGPMTKTELFSYKIKKYSWVFIMVSTAVLLYSFVLHRVYCVPFGLVGLMIRITIPCLSNRSDTAHSTEYLLQELVLTHFVYNKYLLYCFVLHVPFAFSFFSASEYFIAYSNMAYHVSAYYEFSDFEVVYCKVHSYSKTNGNSVHQVMNGDKASPRRLRSREKGEKVC